MLKENNMITPESEQSIIDILSLIQTKTPLHSITNTFYKSTALPWDHQ